MSSTLAHPIPFDYRPPFVRSEALNDRRLFGQLLQDKMLWGEAVEIGTMKGDFAESFLGAWTFGQKLYCVDPYLNPGEGEIYEYDPAQYGQNQEAYNTAYNRLQGPDSFLQSRKVEFKRTTSQIAALDFMRHSLSFVYIDGNHYPPHPSLDLITWWPKLLWGGILAGHDIHHATNPDFPWAQYVKPAVEEFAVRNNLTVYIVEQVPPDEVGSWEDFIGGAWSWYIEKPKDVP